MFMSSRSSCGLALPGAAASSTGSCARASTSRRRGEIPAAAHQGLDALAELFDANDKIVEGQHNAGEAVDFSHLVEQTCHGGVRADQPRAAVGQGLAPADAAGRGIVGGVLVGAGLGAAPAQRLEIDAGLLMLPLAPPPPPR